MFNFIDTIFVMFSCGILASIGVELSDWQFWAVLSSMIACHICGFIAGRKSML